MRICVSGRECKVVLTDSVRCVLSCQSTPILVSRPSLQTAPRLYPVLQLHHHRRLSPKEHNTTMHQYNPDTGSTTLGVSESVRPVPLFSGPIWRQEPWRGSQHNISRVSF